MGFPDCQFLSVLAIRETQLVEFKETVPSEYTQSVFGQWQKLLHLSEYVLQQCEGKDVSGTVVCSGSAIISYNSLRDRIRKHGL